MKRKSYQPIFREFLCMCPYVRNDISKWYKFEEYEIIIELKDGSAYRYDSLNKAFKWAPSPKEFTRPPRNEDEWRYRFSRRLYNKIISEGYNQDAIAYETGISPGAISKYINGDMVPTVYKLQKIADVLNCTVDDLIYF